MRSNDFFGLKKIPFGALVTGTLLMLMQANVWGKWIEVTYPNSQTVLDWACENVIWNSSADVEFVVIDYTVDDGKTWARVPKWGKPSGPSWNDGVSYWNPPWIWTKHAKVRVSDANDATVYGISEFFTIRDKQKDKSMAVASPSSGDVYTAGSTIEISWETSGNIWYINQIDFSSNGGQSWQKIKGYTFIDHKPFIWRLPSAFESDKCVIRLSQTDDDFPITVTGSPFTVHEKPLMTLFKNITAQSGIEIAGGGRCGAWVDWNRDGRDDLFTTAVDGYPNALFLQNEGRSFNQTVLQADVADQTRFDRAGLPADANGDGYFDLFLGGGYGFLDKLMMNDGTGRFYDATSQAGITDTSTETNGAAYLDYDLDGDLDLFICRWQTANALFRNNGDGTFTDAAAGAGVAGPATAQTSAVAAGDYNNDAYPDLYVVNSDAGSTILYRNNQNGTFSDVTDEAQVRLEQNNKSAEWGDFNNDGRLDLFVVRRSAENVLFIQNADGRFSSSGKQANVAVNGDGFAMALADYDCDGYLDILTAYNSGAAKLHLNNGDGTFMNPGEASGFASTYSPRGVAVSDYDQDGDPDVFITDEDGPSRLYANQAVGQNGNHWIEVRLKGKGKNPEAIGAKVQISAGGKKQTRELQAGTGYGNRNSATLHFGLGVNRSVDELRIFWPRGGVSSFAGMKVDTAYIFQEQGESLPASLSLSAPPGGALVRAGGQVTVQWRTTGAVDSVIVSYSTDGGCQWHSMARTRNMGSVQWNVPAQLVSEEAYIRVQDAWNGATSGTSGAFVIESAAIPVRWVADCPEIRAGETMNVSFLLADSLHPVHRLKKASGLLRFSHPLAMELVPGSFSVGELWGANPFVVYQSDSAAGELVFEISAAGEGYTGFGQAAEFQVHVRNTAPAGVMLTLQPEQLVLKNTAGDAMPASMISDSVRVLDSGMSVWPGDTNNDGSVNQDDALPIGVFFGIKGQARTGSTTAWIAQYAAAWTNPKAHYADADGNGTIDENDMAAIVRNWGKSRGSSTPTLPSGEITSAGTAAIKPVIPAGNTAFTVGLCLTDVQGLSALSFVMRYYSDKLTVDSAGMAPSFRNQFVSICSTDSANRSIHVGFARKPGFKEETAYADVFKVWMRLNKNVPDKTPIIFSIENMTAVNASGQRLLLNTSGGGFVTDVAVEADAGTPREFKVYPNYPNPFNPSTTIAFDLPVNGSVEMTVFDLNGKTIWSSEEEWKTAGTHSIIWDGTDRTGETIPSGFYIYQIKTGSNCKVGRCIFLK